MSTSGAITSNDTITAIARLVIIVGGFIGPAIGSLLLFWVSALHNDNKELFQANTNIATELATITANLGALSDRMNALSARANALDQVEREHEGRIVKIETRMGNRER